MGGLLIADAARDIAKNTREGDRMWPHIVGVLGESTPGVDCTRIESKGETIELTDSFRYTCELI